MSTATLVSPVGNYPVRLSRRESKVVEAAQAGYALTVLADGNIFAGNAGNVATAVVPSGAVTMTNAGAFALAANAVTLAKLATGITPSHIIKYVRTGSTSATLTGVLTTDLEIRVVVATGTVTVTAPASTNTLASAPATGDHSIIIRAAA